jgi:hypothetical protein
MKRSALNIGRNRYFIPGFKPIPRSFLLGYSITITAMQKGSHDSGNSGLGFHAWRCDGRCTAKQMMQIDSSDLLP